MRIAFFVSAFPVVSETFIVNQITGLLDRGHEVEIYAREERRLDTLHPEIEQYRLMERTIFLDRIPRSGWRRFSCLAGMLRECGGATDISLLARVLRLLLGTKDSSFLPKLAQIALLLRQVRHGPYDVVHAQFGILGKGLVALQEKGVLPAPLVTSFRGHDITQHTNSAAGYYDELFARGELFLPVSHSLKQRLVARGCDESRIRILHSGINCNRFRYRPRTLDQGEPVRVLTVARLVEMKGVGFGIEAVARLIREGRCVTYSIAGDGPLRPDLESRIHRLGMQEHIHLLGWRDHDQLVRLMEQTHILLTPSVTAANGEQEGIPNVVKEAMAMGIPVASTHHSGIPELVEDGVSGYLAPERDVERLADSLARLIDNPDSWPAMGRAGRAKVEREFDMERLNDDLVALYGSLLTAREEPDAGMRGEY